MFEVGRVYNRRLGIHEPYGGQRQGGISTPRDWPFIYCSRLNFHGFGVTRQEGPWTTWVNKALGMHWAPVGGIMLLYGGKG